MNFCIQIDGNPKHKFNYLNEIKEITIDYRRTDTTLLKFLELHQDKRINIRIDAEFTIEEDLKRILAYKKKFPEHFIVILLNSYDSLREKEIYKEIIKKDIPFFFDETVFSWDKLCGYVQLKPTDIRISGELAFELDKVSELLHEADIRVRSFVNLSQSLWEEQDSLYTYFIRPEDIEVYSYVIDTFEFYDKIKSLNTLYKIYTKDKKWFGNLSEIILNWHGEDINNIYLSPNFPFERISCGKGCVKGRNCKICKYNADLAKILEKNNMRLDIEDSIDNK